MTLSDIANDYVDDLGLRPATLDLEFLQRLNRAHLTHYTFNSLSVVLAQEMPLDVTHLHNKIVTRRRGGYCFEHNKLALHVLSELGFDARLLLAKVVYNRDTDVPRTHRISLVTLDGDDYLLDVGFGPLGPRHPVKISTPEVQQQGNEQFRIVNVERGELGLQVYKDGDFFTLYTFNLHHYSEAECTPAHFYSHKSPDAAFVNNLVIAKKSDNQTESLRNGTWQRTDNGTVTEHTIASEEQLNTVMKEVFDLEIDLATAAFLFKKFVRPSLNQ
ncbi:arylamine N-acetyltransferase [Motilimonas sp. E26]|uniref:arylamine N-acetyltransferase family protein n=1 Tax=Motilimonas sp. E26 TaxID=2865674 RepID=UPI001E592EEC|nr:arylamine N-acetyltransferase [Motilimonas sp. E26]MCE0556366.1 arylamine N-acetyltransferase [Motilimonas sp. E26]